MKRTLLFSLPLLGACTSSDPASPIVTGVPRDDGGATFLDGSADGAANVNDASTSDASPDGSTSCTARGGDAGVDASATPGALATAIDAASAGDIVSLSGLDTSTVPMLAVSMCPAT